MSGLTEQASLERFLPGHQAGRLLGGGFGDVGVVSVDPDAADRYEGLSAVGVGVDRGVEHGGLEGCARLVAGAGGVDGSVGGGEHLVTPGWSYRSSTSGLAPRAPTFSASSSLRTSAVTS